MKNWIENVQKYNGLPQSAIDSLCSMEFEGGEQEMYLGCDVDVCRAIRS